jgi:hypothetical protein
MRTDGLTGMTKLTVAFRNFSKTPYSRNYIINIRHCLLYVPYLLQIIECFRSWAEQFHSFGLCLGFPQLTTPAIRRYTIWYRDFTACERCVTYFWRSRNDHTFLCCCITHAYTWVTNRVMYDVSALAFTVVLRLSLYLKSCDRIFAVEISKPT